MIYKILYFFLFLLFTQTIQAQLFGHNAITVYGGSSSNVKLDGAIAMGEVFTGSVSSRPYASLGIISLAGNKLTTSFEEDEWIKFVTYPNPAMDFIIIESPKLIQTVFLFDTEGRMVLRNNDGQGKVDVHDLKTGTYLIRLITKDSKAYNLGWLTKIQ
ncbi:MAG: T9SS type A sorting domain-containing protein [Saprospiraceae bacterium]|nr:T9SS type A sorting domain-containing protein [Saprospiraceae bacterium]